MNTNINLNIENIITSLVKLYFEYFEIETKAQIQIRVVDNLAKEHKELRPDSAKMFTDLESMNNQNGRLIPPLDKDGLYYVLFNKNILLNRIKNNDSTFVGTIAHELTHAVDYYDFKHIDDKNYSENDLMYNMFQLWSEFHARKLGYKFIRHIVSDALPNSINDQVEYIKNTELPFQLNYFNSNFIKAEGPINKSYELMQFLGRFSVWRELSLADFNNQFIIDKFDNNDSIIDVLEFLEENSTVEMIHDKLSDMLNVLDKFLSSLSF